MIFEFIQYDTLEEIQTQIQKCEGKHTQQAVYSTFHDGLTQICFGCQKIRSSLRIERRKL